MDQIYKLNEGFQVFNEKNKLLFVNKDDAITVELPGHIEEYEPIVAAVTAQLIRTHDLDSESFVYLINYLVENNMIIPASNSNTLAGSETELPKPISCVQVFGKSELSTLVIEQLSRMNFQEVISSEGYHDVIQKNSFPIVIVDDTNINRIDELHARLFASGQEWMLVEPYNGHSITVGPIFLPRATGCLTCFSTRRAANLNLGIKNLSYYEVVTRGNPSFSHTVIAASHASLMCQQWLKDKSPNLPGKFYTITFDGYQPAIQTHHLLRLPRCLTCSKVAHMPVNVPWSETLHTEKVKV